MRFSRQRDISGRQVPLYDENDMAGMRVAGEIAAAVLDHVAAFIEPGISTAELDQICEGFMRDNGALPATIGFKGYRHASCISLNNIVTHGIPSPTRVLKNGDIVNIDITPIVDGWHGDSSRTFLVGDVSSQARALVETAFQAMMAGIAAAHPGATLGDIGHAIETIASQNGYVTVRDFCGHGIGRNFHDAPQVLHYGQPKTGLQLEPGMTFTVEPILNAGLVDVRILADGWTTVTRDRSLSAQFEHTIAITETGHEIFTLSKAQQQSVSSAA